MEEPCSPVQRFRGGTITLEDRMRMHRQKPVTIWLTGLSGAGKSTIAFELERQLVAQGHACYVLDGDNVRHGLGSDLGFDPRDRHENIRRVAHVAQLMNDAGLIVIAALISPMHADRAMARGIIGAGSFIETYVSASLATCAGRDPKGLYAKALAGEIPAFTGISAPYETPVNPELVIDTASLTLSDSVARIFSYLRQHSLAVAA
ncbi:adenylyl-sulfate kinase [Paraburkholderia graminis]|uniref:Adenylyl-sulfate kinase n=1 Tax=Paraburkholderia graminis (strain ATCC 700544 / DSM 17151 / LMG 18924 / NCIMB 13744 / C4D1M) TaxID=396598 RepID=B1FX13_PARG4|nr:adenylyl-sulfate kinase [Paraburkholderia graminis]AXF07039.1 adenylyl-sulfate kinase [Paraburkholderia graminis]EDT11583.1 Adenylyl-sulfate kinase [Paraburkholderia graminis C4D1M]CAB3671156.1 putative adenylyl-sulfate kinase [Paraburkholderia graminis C4D1M]